jgi:ribosomal protein L37AE/L43A
MASDYEKCEVCGKRAMTYDPEGVPLCGDCYSKLLGGRYQRDVLADAREQEKRDGE